MRKQSKKAASYISEFSKQLKQHTESIQSLWAKIEKNTLGLLENEYATKPENKESLTDYIKALHKMMLSIKEANQSVTVMRKPLLTTSA